MKGGGLKSDTGIGFLMKDARFVSLINRFFCGPVYPVLLSLSVIIGHITGLELYTAAINVLAVSVAFIFGDSFRPAIPFACTAVFQVSRINTPGDPSYSDYFLHPARVAVFFVIVALLASSVVIFFVKTRLYKEMGYGRNPLFLGLAVLSVGFLLNGAFSDTWQIKDLLYALLEALAFWFFFVIFYCGLKRESAEDNLGYFIYVSALMAFVLIAELLWLYLFGGVFSEGAIVKEKILFGWGIWNTMGVYLAILIPIFFLGAIRGKRTLLYLALATVTFGAVFLTLSRNAILFGGLGYAVCLIIGCFKGEKRKIFKWVTLVGICLVAVGTVIFFDKISVIFGDLFSRGFSDNGRFELWKAAFLRFKSAPVFGKGFYSFDVDIYAPTTFLPTLAHQTVLEMLSAMGVFGFACYVFYRVLTLKPFFFRPSTEKTMLLISILVMLGESMLDNFIFHFHHLVHYSVALALAFIITEKEERDALLPLGIKTDKENTNV